MNVRIDIIDACQFKTLLIMRNGIELYCTRSVVSGF